MSRVFTEDECWQILRAHFHSPGPLEVARALHRLTEDFGKSRLYIARFLTIDRSTVANAARVLRLSRRVRGMLARGRISFGHARALLGLPPRLQSELARTVQRETLSVRELEALARKHKRALRDAR